MKTNSSFSEEFNDLFNKIASKFCFYIKIILFFFTNFIIN